jgi:hypothetical protein
MIVHSLFFENRLWLPSSIKKMSSESVSSNRLIKSVVIENQSKLEIIETHAFENTHLEFMRKMLFRLQITFLG